MDNEHALSLYPPWVVDILKHSLTVDLWRCPWPLKFVDYDHPPPQENHLSNEQPCLFIEGYATILLNRDYYHQFQHPHNQPLNWHRISVSFLLLTCIWLTIHLDDTPLKVPAADCWAVLKWHGQFRRVSWNGNRDLGWWVWSRIWGHPWSWLKLFAGSCGCF